MDPLELRDLHLTEHWDSFKPGIKGYIPPQPLKLWHSQCDDIEDQIRQFTSADYMRDNNAPFLALSVAQAFPTTSLTIRNETFTAPLSSREIAFLAAHLGNAHASRHTVSAGEVQVLNDACLAAISARKTDVLRKLKASDGKTVTKTTLATLDVFKAGFHELSTAPADNNHFATIFIILPAVTASATIRVCATHGTVNSDVQLPADITQSVSAIGMYAGVSGARIEVGPGGDLICLTYHIRAVPRASMSFVPRLKYLSGALPPLRDAFCLWRHALNKGAPAPALLLFFLKGHPESARQFQRQDATLLCHLAPLAKAYGFTLHTSEFVHTMSTTQEVYHPYKEYLDLDSDFDPSELVMLDDPEVEFEFAELRTLGGVTVAQPALIDLAIEMVQNDDDVDGQVMALCIEKDYEIEDDGPSIATVNYTHTRKASILFVAPT